MKPFAFRVAATLVVSALSSQSVWAQIEPGPIQSVDVHDWASFVAPAAAPERVGPVADEAFALTKQSGPWRDVDFNRLGKAEARLLTLLRGKDWTQAKDWLKQADPDVNAQDPFTKATALTLAAQAGQLDLVRELMRRGAELDRVGAGGATPLGAAVFHGHELVVKDLIRKGARVDVPGATGQLPLHLACATGQVRLIEVLLKAGASYHEVNRQGRHAMDEAALFGQLGAMQTLAHAGASYAEPDLYRLNAVHAAALGQQKDVLAFLERQQVPVPSVLTQVLIDQVRNPVSTP
ncbi:MAG: ankyrin repeat domain-containing protein [Burkholderiales bacterium]|nr:ankyrin repeat domain-containing protein [Burkholderiales bacterium]